MTAHHKSITKSILLTLRVFGARLRQTAAATAILIRVLSIKTQPNVTLMNKLLCSNQIEPFVYIFFSYSLELSSKIINFHILAFCRKSFRCDKFSGD